MLKAVVKDGAILPLQPLSTSWHEGDIVVFAKEEVVLEAEPSAAEMDKAFDELCALCAQGDPEDDERLERALDEMKRSAKEQMRKEMGLA